MNLLHTNGYIKETTPSCMVSLYFASTSNQHFVNQADKKESLMHWFRLLELWRIHVNIAQDKLPLDLQGVGGRRPCDGLEIL